MAASKAISLLQPGTRTSDVAATCSSHANGKRGEHVVDSYAMGVDEKCTHVETRHLSRTSKAQMKTGQNRKHRQKRLRLTKSAAQHGLQIHQEETNIMTNLKSSTYTAKCVASCELCGSSKIFCDHGGLVQGGIKDADLWILVWSKKGDCVDERH